MEEKKKIFISAYACEPDLGSEVGVGWHWVLEMSKEFQLWVLTRQSNRRSIEHFRSSHPGYEGIHFLYYDLPKWARWWKKGRRGVHLYYTLWQTFSNFIVRETMLREHIEIFHHLTYGNVLWKVSAFGQKAKYFIWGPVGGLETIPRQYTGHYSLQSRLMEALRRVIVRTIPLNLGFRGRCRDAALILCKTDITRSMVPVRYRDKAVLFTDVAVEKQDGDRQPQAETGWKSSVDFLTVGRIEGWRGFDLVLEAFAKARFEASLHQAAGANWKPMHLTVMGSGPDLGKLRGIARSLGLNADALTFTGRVPMPVYQRFISGCDVVVNASLKEGAVTVSFDTLSLGKPLICLDTTGYTRYFSPEYSILIPRQADGVERSREAVVSDLAKAMLRLCDDSLRQSMGASARHAGETFTWEHHGREIVDIILKCVSLQNN